MDTMEYYTAITMRKSNLHVLNRKNVYDIK